jgi:dGTP triphosphohydrolase
VIPKWMKNGANYDSEKSTVSLRQYVESLVSELDKRTEAQFVAAKEAVAAALASAEKAVAAALVASDKLTAAAFVAAKEALAEAQLQLSAYKAASNEWRSTLNDLISKVMMRQEIEARFGAIEDRTTKLEGLEQRASGQAEASESGSQRGRWTFQQVLAVLGLLLLAAGLLIAYVVKKP